MTPCRGNCLTSHRIVCMGSKFLRGPCVHSSCPQCHTCRRAYGNCCNMLIKMSVACTNLQGMRRSLAAQTAGNCYCMRLGLRIPTVVCLQFSHSAMRCPMQYAVALNENMSEAAAEPAPKLQKTNTGDIAAAPTPQAAMPGVTPDQAQTAGVAGTVAPLLQKANALQMEGGKKRKVALYISYIGAGYHVSATTQLHILQRMHVVWNVDQAIINDQLHPSISLACLIATPPPWEFHTGHAAESRLP